MNARLALLLAVAFALLRCGYAGQIDLAPDEAYYWEWSRSLDWSYYEQGPGPALAIRLGTALFGATELGVRCMAILSGLGVSVLAVWFCSRIFLAAELSVWVVLAFNTMLLFSAGGILMMHDSLLGFFWLAALAALAPSDNPDKGRAWLLAGACALLGLMSKYTGVLLFGCLGLAALLDTRLRSPWIWAALFLAACGSLPMALWNEAHQWPPLKHTLSLVASNPAYHAWQGLPAYAAAQFGLVSPLLLWLILKGWTSAWARFRSGAATAAENLLFFGSAPVFAFFLLLSGRSFVEGNWPAPAYLGGILLAGLNLHRDGRLHSGLARWALGVSIVFSALAHAQAAWPFLPFPQAFAKFDTVARVDGWKELGARVYAERMRMSPSTSSGPSASPKAFTACLTYQNAAELAFYQPGQQRCLILRQGGVNQYRFWNDPQAQAGRDAILAFGQERELKDMARYFKKVEPLEDEIFYRNKVELRRIHLARAYGFDAAAFAAPAPAPLSERGL
jgi:4-amino-4-deoxy-L-arabinose transferase-like glycosyltransferase